mmetsp:Transcript_95348/g.164498  ORF Transcript_95348/g.164498 Transcript_95348/m.164498 type:complete len:334 (-) Transcript_95348:469-1470(-)
MAANAKKKKLREEAQDSTEAHHIYRPDDTSPLDNAFPGQTINVFVLAQYLYQPLAETGKLYGGSGAGDHYHPDSDIVLAAMHAEKFHPSTLPSNTYGASIELLVQPGQQKYSPKERCGLRSKPFNAPTEICFQPISFKVLFDSNKCGPTRKQKPKKIPKVAPDRVLLFDNTNRLRQAYHINHIRDRGFEEKDFTSTRFQNECLYLGSGNDRYELAIVWQDPTHPGGDQIPLWQWSRLTQQAIDILIADVLFPDKVPELTGPLQYPYHEVVFSGLAWNELVWDTDSVSIRGQRFPLTTMEWKKRGYTLGDHDEYTEQDFFPDPDPYEDKDDDEV